MLLESALFGKAALDGKQLFLQSPADALTLMQLFLYNPVFATCALPLQDKRG
jgi:hypothetical protein